MPGQPQRPAVERDEEVHAVHAQRDEVDVGDPDDVDDAEDQIEAEGEEGEHAAEQDAVDHRLEQEDGVDHDSEPHVRFPDEVLLGEVGGPALHLGAAHLEEIGPVHELQHLAHVLLHDQDGVALLAHAADQVEEPEHHDRRQAHGRLVEQDQLGARHEGAAHREHLLLAAREAARSLALALGQHGKERVHALEALAVVRPRRGQERAHLQIVGHGELREEPPALGHVRDAVGDDVIRRMPGQLHALEGDVARARRDQARR